MRLAAPLAGLALLALMPWSTAAVAEDAARPAAQTARPLLGKRVADTALARQRGGTEVVNDTLLKGVVSDNQAVNVVTGSNVIGGGAFAGAAGVPVVIQNSGNNVLIQSSTIVNVTLK